MHIRPMQAEDYDGVIALWDATEGVAYHPGDADSRPSVARFLRRNPGLSWVAEDEGQIVAAVLCGHDGRRGGLHHLAVAQSHRRRGLAQEMVQRCLEGLAGEGIAKCSILVFGDNRDGLAFWERNGWTRYPGELVFLQKRTDA
ncbi:MAG: GNAT family N-acetyltransferase [Phycisphaerae bacterium]